MDHLQVDVFDGLCQTLALVGFPGVSAGKESSCNVGDLSSIPGLGRFPWGRKRLPTPVFWPGEFPGLYSPWGCKESDTTERLSLSLYRYCLACGTLGQPSNQRNAGVTTHTGHILEGTGAASSLVCPHGGGGGFASLEAMLCNLSDILSTLTRITGDPFIS